MRQLCVTNCSKALCVCETEEGNLTILDAGRQTNKMNYTAAVNGHRQERCVLGSG